MQSVIDFPWKPLHVTATVLVKTGAGVLHTIVINSIAAQASVTVYDGINNGGTLLGIITPTASQSVSLLYGAKVLVGIYIVIGGAVDLTVTFI